MIGHAVEISDGSLQEYLNKTQTEQELLAIVARKAKAWEVEQLAKALGGQER